MIFNSENIFTLSGTNFGLLSTYEKARYFDGYFFNDIYLNTDISYSRELSTFTLLDFYTNAEILNLSGLKLWLDAQDTSTWKTSSISTTALAITGISDKSTNSFYFTCFRNPTAISNEALSAYWPRYSLPLSSSSLPGRPCIKMNLYSIFNNPDFKIDINSPFSIYFVWRDLNTFNYSVPFSIKTVYNTVTSEIAAINQYQTNYLYPEQLLWGLRDFDFGIRVPNLSGLFFKENLLNWRYDGSEFSSISSKSLLVNNLSVVITDNIILSSEPINILSGTNIGYYQNNYNDFYFGEMLIFNRILNDRENILLLNYLYNKWNLYDLMTDNVTITANLSAGFLTNTAYEDFSVLTSRISLPIQSCINKLTINLESFDQTVSKISKVQYIHNDNFIEIPSTFTIILTDVQIDLSQKRTDFILVPDKDKQVSTYYVYLSVYRYDSTVNKFILSGNLTKCSITDYYNNTVLVDAQVLDNSKEVLLVSENRDKSTIFTNTINVTVPVQALTGGEVQELVNNEVVQEDEGLILLADLLEEEQVKETFKLPGLVPTPAPRINPIKPV